MGSYPRANRTHINPENIGQTEHTNTPKNTGKPLHTYKIRKTSAFEDLTRSSTERTQICGQITGSDAPRIKKCSSPTF